LANIVNQGNSSEGARRKLVALHQIDVGDGDWLKYSAVDFGSGAGFNQLLLRMWVSPQNQGQKITVHLDSLDGPVAGSAVLSTTTDGINVIDYAQYTVAIDNVTGMHALYLTFAGATSFSA